MNGSRIASRSTASSVSLPAQSLRAASSDGALPSGQAAMRPVAIAVARSLSWGLGESHAAISRTRAVVYAYFIGASGGEQGDQRERSGIHGERAGPGDVVDGIGRFELRGTAERQLHDRDVRLNAE